MATKVEVTVPLKLSASMTFLVDSEEDVTEALIAEKIADAQRAIDRDGNDAVTGIYFVIEGHEPPVFGDA